MRVNETIQKSYTMKKNMKKYTLEFEKPIRELEINIEELTELEASGEISLTEEIDKLKQKTEKLREKIYSNLNRWQHVQLARHPMRPFSNDYLKLIATDFVELHGDRKFRDDAAVVSGLAKIDDNPVLMICHQKGRGTKDNLKRNFAMPNPEGYRKAKRIMRLAEKFDLPLITLIDTPGAYPGLGAEERGQAAAIADNLFEMAQLKIPIIAVILGEGGSGGALALGVADKVFMMEHSIYSVISPEGCASILYRDASHAQEAAEALKLTSKDLMELGVIDGIIKEPLGGAHHDINQTAQELKIIINKNLSDLLKINPEERILSRIDKFAKMGFWEED